MMMRASGLRGYIPTMRSLRVDPYELLHQFKLDKDLLENDETLIPQQAVIDLLETSAAIADCPDLGLRISIYQDISILGLLSVMLQNATSMRKAVEYASDFLFIHGQGFSLSFNESSSLVSDSFEIVFDTQFKSSPPIQSIDLCIGAMHQISKWLCGKDYGLKAVTLPYTPTAPLAVYKKFFNAPIYINQERAALHINKDFLFLQPNGANPLLRHIAEDYFSRHFRTPDSTFKSRVEKVIKLNLSTTKANKIDISKILNIHPRTLQRRLKEENTSFDEIKDNLRKELASYYIKNTDIPLYQLTLLLGYPEQSALSRATKRWFNSTPSELRAIK